MLWISNFFIDVANVLALWVPLLCYFVIAVCGLYVACKLYGFGRSGPRDGLKVFCAFVLALFCAGFITYQNALDVTMNFPATVHAGGEPFAYFTNAPQLMGTTPQGWFLATVQTFMPFFKAFGSATILRGVFRGASAHRDGAGVWVPVSAYTLAGTFLCNIDIVVQDIFNHA